MAVKRGTPARKAARTQAAPKDVRPPVKHVEIEKDPETDLDDDSMDEQVDEPAEEVPAAPALVHPYGDKQVYVYKPKDGSAPIVFPHITELKPTQSFFFRIYRLNEMFQSFEWMDLAQVPRPIQQRVIDMGEKNIYEQAEFFRGWFAPIVAPQDGMVPPGES